MQDARRRMHEVYQFISEELYRVREDLEIGDHHYSSQLLFSLLGFVLRSLVFLVGDYGQGKTALAELVGSMLGGLPYPAVRFAVLRGSPEITEDKIVGLVDLGKLQTGVVEVIWSPFVRSPVKVVDEITRIPEIKQAMLLEGVRTGQWQIYGRMFPEGTRSPLFATANFDSVAGTFEMVPALQDRFSIGLATEYPGVEACLDLVVSGDLEDRAEKIGLAAYTEEAIRVLSSRSFDADLLDSLRARFKQHLVTRGIPTLSDQEMSQAEEEIRRLGLRDDALLLMRFLISSLNACPKAGQKRGEQYGNHQGECPIDCKFYDSPCSWVLGGGSRRVEKALGEFARAVAWFRGASAVESEDIAVVAPFVIWHRREFSRDLMRKTKLESRRGYPMKLEAAFHLVGCILEEYREQRDLLSRILDGKDQVVVHTGTDGEIRLRLDGQVVKPSELLVAFVHDYLELAPLPRRAVTKEREEVVKK